ncbi:hypothetical protein K458DRAFT_414023 [Lentithecium fluviatile CBS 122367]|uniref:Uncharacterized protein n=1 Tax=Lentithecium fluviatile CBS 122367 TaxID=1168545 RepID=A0A6G1JGT9_9PLEO|nr:hypothetical protein K458DRAFT_414023 [Lentithecium fluviatile CBS 122367]
MFISRLPNTITAHRHQRLYHKLWRPLSTTATRRRLDEDTIAEIRSHREEKNLIRNSTKHEDNSIRNHDGKVSHFSVPPYAFLEKIAKARRALRGSLRENIASESVPQEQIASHPPVRPRLVTYGSEFEAKRRALSEKQALYESSCSGHIASIQLNSIRPSQARVKLSEPELACSYNLDHEGNLYVPGAPRLYTKHLPISVEEGPSSDLAEPPTADLPTHLRHALSAISLMQGPLAPTFSFADVSIAISLPALKSLLSHVTGASLTSRIDGFPMHMVRNTLFIDIFEPSEPLTTDATRSLKQKTTHMTHGIPETSRHYRWIHYKRGNTRIAVFMEAEAYTPNPDAGVLGPRAKRLLKSANALTTTPTPPPSPAPKLFVTPNDPIPQSQLIMLRTALSGAKPDRRSFKAMYALVHIPYIIEGILQIHKRKSATIVRLKQSGVRLESSGPFFTQKREEIKQVQGLLTELQQVVKRGGKGTCVGILSSIRGGETKIHVHEAETKRGVLDQREVPAAFRVYDIGLGEEVIQRFWGSEEKAPHKD